MKLTFKNVLLSTGAVLFSLALFAVVGVSSASAAACTMTTGTWNGTAGGVNDGATNGTSTFSSCTGGLTPAVGDTLTIASGVTLTVTGNATVAGITLSSPTAANGLTVNTAVTLTNSGALTYTANAAANAQTVTIAGTGVLANATGVVNAPTSTGNSLVTCSGTGSVTFSSTLAMTGNSTTTGKASFGMGACTLSAAGITLTGGTNATGVAEITATTGTVSSSSGITFAGTAADAKLTVSGAGAVTLSGTTGTIGTGGTLTLASTSTTSFTGSGTQVINVYGYGNLTLGGTGAKTVGSALTVAGDLTVNGTAVATLTGNSTANRLYLGNVLARAGSWGGNISAASYVNTTYFGSGGTGKVTSALGKNISYQGDINNGGNSYDATASTDINPADPTSGISTDVNPTPVITAPVVTATPVAPVVTPAPTVSVTSVPAGCGTGSAFNTMTGQPCASAGASVWTSPTANNYYNFGTKTLKNGSSGDAVMELQRFLNAKLNLGLTVDGKLGPKTIAVVKKWQKDHGLKADGLIGTKTKEEMNASAQ